jgi:hypothetical protein
MRVPSQLKQTHAIILFIEIIQSVGSYNIQIPVIDSLKTYIIYLRGSRVEGKRFRQPTHQTAWVPERRTGKIKKILTMNFSAIIQNSNAVKNEKLKFVSILFFISE